MKSIPLTHDVERRAANRLYKVFYLTKYGEITHTSVYTTKLKTAKDVVKGLQAFSKFVRKGKDAVAM